MSKEYLVIEIGSRNIKILEGFFDKKKIIVKQFSILKTPLATITNGIIMDQKSIGEVIARELQQKKIKTKNAILVISGDISINREILVPKVSQKELNNILLLEAAQYFPVNLDGYNVAYKIIDEVKDEGQDKYKLYVSAVELEVIRKYMNILENCGLELKIIDVAPNTLCKLTSLETKARDNDLDDLLAVIDLGYNFTKFILIQDNKVKFEKNINLGIVKLIELVAQVKGVDNESAEQILKENFKNYMINKDNNIMSLENRVAKFINGNLCGSINKLFDFYMSRNNNVLVNDIILTGGGLNIDGMDKVIFQYIGVKGQILNDLKCVVNKSNDDFKKVELQMASALGALIRGEVKN